MLTLVGGPSSGERNAARRDAHDDLRRDQRAGQRAGAVEARRHLRGVLDAAAHEQRAVARAPAERTVNRPPSNCVLARSPSGTGPSSIRRSAASWRSPLGARNRSVPDSVGAGGPGSIGDALEPGVVERAGAFGRVGRRVDDPERRRGRVLGRAGRVRVQRVALVQQRVDELVDAAVSHRAPRESRSETQASSVASPRSSFARWSASSVWERSATQAVFGVVVLDRLPPHRHRHPEVDRLRPRDQHHLQAAVLAGVVDHAVEVQRERRLAVGERVQVLGRGDLEVVVARDRDRDRGRAGERRHEHVELGPDQAAGRHRPALGRAEQLDQPLARGVVVAPPRRLDHQLDRQRDHVHLAAAGSDTWRSSVSIGAAAYLTVRAPSTANSRSGGGSGTSGGVDSVRGSMLKPAPPSRAARRRSARPRRARRTRPRSPPSAP